MIKKTYHTQYDKELLILLSKMINEVFFKSNRFRVSSKNCLRKVRTTFNGFFKKRYGIDFVNEFHILKACDLCGLKRIGDLTVDSYVFTCYRVHVDLNTKDLNSMLVVSRIGLCGAGEEKMKDIDDFMDRVIAFEQKNKDLFKKYFNMEVTLEKFTTA